jgi:hypothetical protein
MRTIALLHLGRRAISQGIEKRYEGIAMANKPARIAQATPSLQLADPALGHTARLMPTVAIKPNANVPLSRHCPGCWDGFRF